MGSRRSPAAVDPPRRRRPKDPRLEGPSAPHDRRTVRGRYCPVISLESHSARRASAQSHSPVLMAQTTALPTILKPYSADPSRAATSRPSRAIASPATGSSNCSRKVSWVRLPRCTSTSPFAIASSCVPRSTIIASRARSSRHRPPARRISAVAISGSMSRRSAVGSSRSIQTRAAGISALTRALDMASISATPARVPSRSANSSKADVRSSAACSSEGE